MLQFMIDLYKMTLFILNDNTIQINAYGRN